MHTRTTIILRENVLDRARKITGIQEKTALVHAALECLVARGGRKPRAMIVVDTSVWAEPIRRGYDAFEFALTRGRVAVHDFVIGGGQAARLGPAGFQPGGAPRPTLPSHVHPR